MGLLFGAAGLVSITMRPRLGSEPFPKPLAGSIPEKIGPWSTTEQAAPPPEASYANYYDDTCIRDYELADGRHVALCIAYVRRQSGLKGVHRPEVCFKASGFAVTSLEQTVFPIGGCGRITGNSFFASQPGLTQSVLYWIRSGGAFPSTAREQSWGLRAQRLHGIAPDGVLVRFSTLDDTPAAGALISSFATSLFEAIDAATRTLLLGPYAHRCNLAQRSEVKSR